MKQNNITDQLKNHLEQAACQAPLPHFAPLAISPWMAMSLLQKAIRRGEVELALRAAATLIEVSPDRLWRRLLVIAFEDVGVADIDSIALTVAAVGSRSVRKQLGGDWLVASWLVDRLARARKCRAADDLLMVAEVHATYRAFRTELAEASFQKLIDTAVSDQPMPLRALALWFAVGTDRCQSNHLPPRPGDPSVFDHLIEAGYPRTIVEVAREGCRKSREIICAMIPLLWREAYLVDTEVSGTPTEVIGDPLPPVVFFDGVPGWCMDKFTREGRKALKLLLQSGCESARWINEQVPRSERMDFLGHILFRIESGLMINRFDWPLSNKLRYLADVECNGEYCEDASVAMSLLCADISFLNEARGAVFRNVVQITSRQS